MKKRIVAPPHIKAIAERVRMSPAIAAGEFVFLTGMTGVGDQGMMPTDPAEQFRNVFEKVALILSADGLVLNSIVEMTTYHVGLREHFDLFDSVRLGYLDAPYPAWTAVEVAGLRREGAIVEMRVIAHRGSNS